MRTCPKCNRSYDDESLNFCLDDGEWLTGDEVESGESTKFLPGALAPSEAKTRQRISTTDETAVLPSGAISAEERAARKGPPVLLIAGAVVGVLAALAGLYGLLKWYGGDAEQEGGVPKVETERLTGDGNVYEAAISPDGKFLAYLEVKGNEKSLRMRQIETNSTVEILKESEFEDINNVVFSPDGNFVFFSGIDSEKKMSVYKVATLGGNPIPIPVAAMSFTLSPDGTRIIYFKENAETSETALVAANIDGTEAKTIVEAGGKQWVESGTAWSPDGKMLLVLQGDDNRVPEPLLSLALYNFEDNSLTDLGSDRWETVANRGAVWGPSGKFIYLSANREAGEPMRVWRVSFPEGKAERLTSNEKRYLGLSITADGNRLVTREVEDRSGIWISPDLDPKNVVEVLPSRGDTWGLDWTPDGRIVYVSDQSGAPEVWSMAADGSDQKQLTSDRIPKRAPFVSPDGTTIVYASPVEGQQIYKVPIGGGSAARLDTGQVGPDNPVFSADGKFIVFTAWPDGKQSLFRIAVEGGKAERLTDYFSTKPSFSPDGSMIACFFIAPDERFYSAGVIGADGGAPLKKFGVPLSTTAFAGLKWTPDGSRITYIVSEGEKRDLWAQPLAGGDPVRLTDFSRPWIQRAAYSRDGKRIAITRGEVLQNALMLRLAE